MLSLYGKNINMENRYYVYLLLDPFNKVNVNYKGFNIEYKPFYVGMGIGNRISVHGSKTDFKNCKNPLKINKIKIITTKNEKVIKVKIYEGLSREEANKEERELIRYFGRIIDKSGILTNITEGGDSTLANINGGNNIHSKRIYQYDLNGNFLNSFDCLRSLDKKFVVSYNTIGDACRANLKSNTSSNSAGGYLWFYEFKGNKTKKYTPKINYKKVEFFIYDVKNNFKEYKFTTCKDIYNFLNIQKNNFTKIIKNKIFKNYIISEFKLSKNELYNLLVINNYYFVQFKSKEYICKTLQEIGEVIGKNKHYVWSKIRNNKNNENKYEF